VIDPPRQLVVGAAIIRDGAVLAARRTAPADAAGRWEFPGGKVEPGESAEVALVREIAEELGCRMEVTGWLPGTALIGAAYELRVACGVLTEGEPTPAEHDLIRWVSAEELDALDWLDPDRPFLAALRERLRERMAP
jgi:8-oxo-dGTP diphosphatase